MRKSKRLSFLVGVLALGCGSSGQEKIDQGPVVSGPAGEGAGVRLFSGTATVLDDGASCTQENGATGDRWCGFVPLSSAGERLLYVVNVTQVMAGVPVTCDAPDPNCLLLTDLIGGSGENWHPTHFDGDTLVYYTLGVVPHVWRPGMESGRLLAERPETHDVVFCTPAPKGTVVACLAVPIAQPDPRVVAAHILAGAADGESEPLLTSIDEVIWSNAADLNAVERFSQGFPTNGYVAWTSREGPTGPAPLRLQRVDDAESAITVAENAYNWRVTEDDSRWFWETDVNELGEGLLQTALFPDGADPIDVLEGVRAYVVDATGLVALTGDDDLVAIPDPVGAPETRVLVDQKVKAFVKRSDNGHVAYAKTFTGNRGDLFITTTDGSELCTLDAEVRSVRDSIRYSPNAETALWSLVNGDTQDVYHTRLDDCTTELLATGAALPGWISPTLAVFVEDSPTAAGTLLVRRLSKDGTSDSAPPTVIAGHVSSYATSTHAVMYTVKAGGEEDGVYVRAFARDF